MKPRYDDIAYFLEVKQTLNLSRAAERLGITQPSLSAAMKRLESALDTHLLVRGRQGVQLTREGITFSHQCKEFMISWEKMKSSLERSVEGLSGLFTLGCHPSLAIYTLPHLLPKLIKHHPGLEFRLMHDLSRRITERVISHEIDFGLVINPVSHPDLVISRVLNDKVGFWVNTHFINTNSASLDNYPLIFDPNLKQTKKLLAGVSSFRHMECNNLDVIASLVDAGVGIGVLPQRVAESKPYTLTHLGKDKHVIPGLHATVDDELCVIYRADMQTTAASQYLKSAITEHLQQLGLNGDTLQHTGADTSLQHG